MHNHPSGDPSPSQEEIIVLKELGSRWNPKRKVWQNACGLKTRQSKGDPRTKYHVLKLEKTGDGGQLLLTKKEIERFIIPK